ncbi:MULTISPECIES: jacalin-like lectin [Actinopolyspora]|uniref:Jacalin-like lectin domain-containing protein n=1 Tax=Actinopolyspora saharensis TaxID=995062 RepID=A0A1H1EU97_9ACTN|nr:MULTISPECIES: jacalin-like lectin [Actinopolyspora]NHD18231.1 endonuclease [Actinopolyspora sp. BKK2]NHE77090.1 endonuclease [Actinopolyspora sp. BKK1]SDQ92347.1 Jacalin-like lectin domain-containing protein [Actinopolyspora saharensis]
MLRPLVAGIAALAATAAVVTVPASTPAAAESPESGSFTAVTYNIAGLPDGLSSGEVDRETATTAIGERLNSYDLINVQEDFNYHAALYSGDNHPHRTSTTGGAGIGSGLNSMSNRPYSELDRVTWDDCWIGSGDCLTPKGFTFRRVRLAEGVYLDVYNLHADAGVTDGDLEARRANLEQLSTYLQSHSQGNAVLVMGDTNTRYTREGDDIADFASDNGLTDAWVQRARGGTAPAPGSDALLCPEQNPGTSCEVVDKILYRGSELLSLDATSYRNLDDEFRTDDGRKLSDHFPIAADFTWTRNPDFRASDVLGGPHGTPFTDVEALTPGTRPTSVSLAAGERVDRVGATLDDGTELGHGGAGGTARTLALAEDEYVDSVRLCRGEKDGHTRVFYARLTTNTGRGIAGGTDTGDCLTRTTPEGWQLAGFHGREGDELDSLGLLYTRR